MNNFSVPERGQCIENKKNDSRIVTIEKLCNFHVEAINLFLFF